MEIDQSPLQYEIDDIQNRGDTGVAHTWMATIYANGQEIDVQKVLDIRRNRDFENNFAPELMIRVAILAGTFMKQVVPYQDSLEISLFKYPMFETGDGEDPNGQVWTQKYRAIYLDKGNPNIENSGQGNVKEEAMNLTTMLDNIEFQLIDKVAEQVRVMTVGGTYRASLPGDVLRTILLNESKNIIIDDAEAIKGVDMVTPNNDTSRTHVVLPQRLTLDQIPPYIQNRCGGIYSTDLGFFLENGFWYVYPRYDTTRFQKAQQKLVVINVPSNRYSELERTYKVDDDVVTVLANGNASFTDNSNVLRGMEGNGVRFADATNMVDGFNKTANNKTTVNRAVNNSEFMSSSMATGQQNVRVSPQAITSNRFAQFSALAKREGSLFMCEWRWSNPDLIRPGMATRIFYLDGDDVKELEGTTLMASAVTMLRGQGMTAASYFTTTVLAVFVNRIIS